MIVSGCYLFSRESPFIEEKCLSAVTIVRLYAIAQAASHISFSGIGCPSCFNWAFIFA